MTIKKNYKKSYNETFDIYISLFFNFILRFLLGLIATDLAKKTIIHIIYLLLIETKRT